MSIPNRRCRSQQYVNPHPTEGINIIKMDRIWPNYKMLPKIVTYYKIFQNRGCSIFDFWQT